MRAHRQHRQPLAPRQKRGDEAGEGKDAGLGRRRGEPLAQPDQLEKGAVELNDMVLRAPGMAVARPDLKAETAIELGLRPQIARGDDEMIDGARHVPASRRLLQLHHVVQRRVGLSKKRLTPRAAWRMRCSFSTSARRT